MKRRRECSGTPELRETRGKVKVRRGGAMSSGAPVLRDSDETDKAPPSHLPSSGFPELRDTGAGAAMERSASLPVLRSSTLASPTQSLGPRSLSSGIPEQSELSP